MSVKIVCAWGIGNRLRALASGIILSEELNLPYKIVWTHVDTNCNWEELFENKLNVVNDPLLVKEKDLNLPRPYVKDVMPWHTLRGSPTVDCVLDIKQYCKSELLQDFLNHVKENSFEILTFLSYRLEAMNTDIFLQKKFQFYRSLDPTPEIKSLMNNYTSQFNEYTVGVHIRGTDRAIYLNSFLSINEYKQKMDNQISKNPQTRFYVASDEVEKLISLTDQYGDKIINQYHKNSNFPQRMTLEGHKMALIDLFCLGRTKYIIGTDQSTFTYEAYHLSCAYYQDQHVTLDLVYNRSTNSRYGAYSTTF